MRLSKKRTCDRCKAILYEGLGFCQLGFQTTIFNGNHHPKETCPMPLSKAALLSAKSKGSRYENTRRTD